MKKNIVLKILMSLIVSATAAQAGKPPSLAGKYSSDTQIVLAYANDRISCNENDGDWDAELEVCFVTATNSVVVEMSDNGYSLAVSTVGNNLHTCDFEDIADRNKKGNVLTAKTLTEEFSSKKNAVVNVTCKVSATFTGDEVSVKTNGRCQSFCGMSARLEVEGLKKVQE